MAEWSVAPCRGLTVEIDALGPMMNHGAIVFRPGLKQRERQVNSDSDWIIVPFKSPHTNFGTQFRVPETDPFWRNRVPMDFFIAGRWGEADTASPGSAPPGPWCSCCRIRRHRVARCPKSHRDVGLRSALSITWEKNGANSLHRAGTWLGCNKTRHNGSGPRGAKIHCTAQKISGGS